MAEEKMYSHESNSGNYVVNFPNRKALSNDEIIQIFSEFGEVKSVGCAGDTKGFRFVNFSEEDAAIKAIEGLKDSPVVTLVPRRPKNKNTDKNSGNNNRDNSGGNNYRSNNQGGESNWSFGNVSEREPSIDRRGSNNSFDNRNDDNDRRGNSKFGNRGDGDNNDRRRNDKSGNRFDGKENNGDHRKGSGRAGNNYNGGRKNRENSVSRSYQDSQNEPKTRDDTQKNQRNFNNRRDSHSQSDGRKNGPKNSFKNPESEEIQVWEKVPASIADSFKNQSTFNQREKDGQEQQMPGLTFVPDMLQSMPKLVPLESQSLAPGGAKWKQVLLKEVIVANLPADYGAPYVLHLLDKFSPISVSDVQMIPESGLRYCRAYFETEEQAFAVESTLDQWKVDDKNLIVLGTPSLIEQGKTSFV